MAKMKLTDLAIDNMKPPPEGKQIDIYDAHTPGLVLRINYGGAKVWRALYYRRKVTADGKKVTIPTTHKLGRYPHLKVKAARKKASEFLVDPTKALAADGDSFAQVAESYIRHHVDRDTAEQRQTPLRTKPEIVRCLDKYVLPKWRHLSFRDIKRSEINKLLDEISDGSGMRQAAVVLGILRSMMNWYVKRNDDYVNPIARGASSKGKQRHRTLDDEEIRAVWQACTEQGSTFGALVKVALLTGQRRDKVATMKWSDLKDGVWTIATEPREKPNAGRLRLPQMVLDIIAAQPRIEGNEYVFTGRGERPYSDFGNGKLSLDAKLPGMPHWVVHDLRRTARTLMSRSEAGIASDIAERVLGHTIKGVEGVYNRHSYDSDKAEALKRLAALVAAILDPPAGDNVVPLHG